MPKKSTPFTFRFIIYKYDISEAQDGSEAEYEVLFAEYINNGFFIPDMSFLDDDLHSCDFDSIDLFIDLAMGQVHEVVANVEPWAEQCTYEGDWDGGIHWHDFAYRRLVGKELKEFLQCHPRCNRLHGMDEENIFHEAGGEGCYHSMQYDLAIGSLDVPEELRHLPDDTMEAMTKYFKATFTKYAVAESE